MSFVPPNEPGGPLDPNAVDDFVRLQVHGATARAIGLVGALAMVIAFAIWYVATR